MTENGGHGHAMCAPCPGLRCTTGQTDAVGKRGMGSKTCMSPKVRHKQHTSACNQRKAGYRRVQEVHRQRTSVCR